MSNYTSENTTVLKTHQDGDNLRMLLLHDCGERHEYIIGSYFKQTRYDGALGYERWDYSWDWGHYFQEIEAATEFWRREVLGQVAHIVVKQAPSGNIRNACSHCDVTVQNIGYFVPANYCPSCGYLIR